MDLCQTCKECGRLLVWPSLIIMMTHIKWQADCIQGTPTTNKPNLSERMLLNNYWNNKRQHDSILDSHYVSLFEWLLFCCFLLVLVVGQTSGYWKFAVFNAFVAFLVFSISWFTFGSLIFAYLKSFLLVLPLFLSFFSGVFGWWCRVSRCGFRVFFVVLYRRSTLVTVLYGLGLGFRSLSLC